jgi:hypothetical protein
LTLHHAREHPRPDGDNLLLRTYTGERVIGPGVAQTFANLLIVAMVVTGTVLLISRSPVWLARFTGFSTYMRSAKSSFVWSVASIVLLVGVFIFIAQMDTLVYRTVPRVEGRLTPEYARVRKEIEVFPTAMVAVSALAAVVGLITAIRVLRQHKLDRRAQLKYLSSILLAILPLTVAALLVLRMVSMRWIDKLFGEALRHMRY